MRFLVSIGAFLFVMTQAHWTQGYQHVTVTMFESCMPLAGAKQEDKRCVYSDVSVQGSILRQGVELTDKEGATVFLVGGKDNMRIAWTEPGGAGFTWRTYLLFAFWVVVTIWCMLPDFKWITDRFVGRK